MIMMNRSLSSQAPEGLAADAPPDGLNGGSPIEVSDEDNSKMDLERRILKGLCS